MNDLFYGMGAYRAQMKAAVAEASATVARDSASEARREVRSLETEVDRLELLLKALWSILQERVGITEEELLERVRAIDLADGTLDGKADSPRLTVCPDCDRKVSARNVRCIYCGASIEASPL